MSEEQPTLLSGTIIRGADGVLYLIPDEDVESFRMSVTAANTVSAVFEEGSEHASEVTAVDALHVVIDAHAAFGCHHNCWHGHGHDQSAGSSAEEAGGTDEAKEYGADED